MHPKSHALLEVHIFMGETGRKNKAYSSEFKISDIMYMREHHFSFRENSKAVIGVIQS